MDLTLKELLDIATTHLKDISTVEHPDFRIEQVEFLEKEEVWDVVVSYLVANSNVNKNAYSLSTHYPFQREYKRLKIDKNKQIKGFYIYNK